MIISINAGVIFDKIQHIYLLKTLSKLKIGENFLKLIKGIHENLQQTSCLMIEIVSP